MTLSQSRYIACLDREIHLMEWGSAHAETVIAWHGLARTGRDMDAIASRLAARWRVICPDTIGRGLSQWASDPAREYCLANYAAIAASLVDQLGIDRMHWLGTSMGGAIGLHVAAGALRGRIRSLVMNDIGPQLAAPAVARIRGYAGRPPAFATMAELEAYFRTVYAPYGWLSDAQWRLLAETSARRLPDGRVTPHYDPSMVRQFEDHPRDYDQWDAWDGLPRSLPVLVLRGESSDLLEPSVAEDMTRRGPHARLVTVTGCGHAPALNTDEQIGWVERFLLEAAP
jgi:pimeloyl-ACP methyl ester carboxylesterase